MRVIYSFKTKLKQIAYIIITGFVIISSSCFTNIAKATDPSEITATYPYYAFIEDENNPWKSVFDALDTTGTINYSDTYFDEPSPGDHPKLRAASYALALAGYENQADGYPLDPSSPNPKLYDFLNQLGFLDPESWDVSSEADGHSMGTTIAHKTLPSGQELVVVAPRNYNYMTEWLSNFNVGDTGDHAGFTESANLVVNRFYQYITDHNFTDYKAWVVGYSRGGAVIDLFGKAVNSDITKYHLSPDDFYVYTFGAPRASTVATNYTNIHDVKDGNDLLLGYVFPELWGFYNTGAYEEVNPADLDITTSMVNIVDLADGTKAFNVLSDNEGLTEDVDTINGRDFMDSWYAFVNENGFTREYFNTQVKPPLSAIMKVYQLRHLDQQSEITDFITSFDGLLGMFASKAFNDIGAGGYISSLEGYPLYDDLVKVLKGTADNNDINELITYLTNYIGEYEEYPELSIEKPEFNIIKTNLPQLVKALAPLLIADAKYTQATYGEDYSLYYTYSLIKNATNLVYGHIPESFMKVLKNTIPEEDDEKEEDPEEEPNKNEDEPEEDEKDEEEPEEDNEDDEEETIIVPNTGTDTYFNSFGVVTSSTSTLDNIVIISLISTIISIVFLGYKVSQRRIH